MDNQPAWGTYRLPPSAVLHRAGYMLPGADFGVIEHIELRKNHEFTGVYAMLLHRAGYGVSLGNGPEYPIRGRWSVRANALTLQFVTAGGHLDWPPNVECTLGDGRLTILGFGKPWTLLRVKPH